MKIIRILSLTVLTLLLILFFPQLEMGGKIFFSLIYLFLIAVTLLLTEKKRKKE